MEAPLRAALEAGEQVLAGTCQRSGEQVPGQALDLDTSHETSTTVRAPLPRPLAVGPSSSAM